ncbi:hypothetical protein LCGC14_1296240 [marine sediment metagenome]|uniref:Uncharacterized protein n=1 Tax=marine sediment metagenome TaxID=412755 RepID=A0A0F9KSQ5_9ZZZZ
MSADIIEGLIVFLQADIPLAALVGTRVFGNELPRAEDDSMARKAVVLQPSGGPILMGGSYVRHTSQRFDIFSYGETVFQCQRVSRAVFDALKQLQRSVSAGVLIHWVDPAGGFANIRDPDARWPINFQSFQAFYAEEAAA